MPRPDVDYGERMNEVETLTRLLCEANALIDDADAALDHVAGQALPRERSNELHEWWRCHQGTVAQHVLKGAINGSSSD